jgi:pimeloyl-ACP methyl ester carboxylesterase
MPTVTVNDIAIYYEIHGEGEPLLLIGGLSNDVTDYARMIPELSQKYRVVAFDNRGVGRTDKPDIPYSISMMADDTAGLLNALGLGPVNVLGVSMCGRIAVDLALRYPEFVKSLILVSTYVKRIQPTWSSRLLDVLLKIPYWRTRVDQYPQPSYAFRRQREASRRYDASDRLPEISVPTLILHGKKDRFAPYRLAQEMHTAIQGSQMNTVDGGHLFLFMKQGLFLDAVEAFLDMLTARAQGRVRGGVL